MLNCAGHRAGLFTQRAGRFGDTGGGLCHVFGSVRDVRREARRFGRGRGQKRGNVAEFLRHRDHGAGEPAELTALGRCGGAFGEVAAGDRFGDFGEFAELVADHR
jgi:hypothetical protein